MSRYNKTRDKFSDIKFRSVYKPCHKNQNLKRKKIGIKLTV